MIATRRNLFLAAQWLFAAAIVWAAVRSLRGQWSAATQRLSTISIGWTWIVGATVIVFLTYLLLIETWRRLLTGWNAFLPFGVASRIWFVSNLGKYLPGKIWSIAAMSVMARERGVSPVAAAGSSVIIQVITIATGIALVAVTGMKAIDQPVLAIAIAVILMVSLALLPIILPRLGAIAASLTGKEITIPPLRSSVIWLAVARSLLSWIAYGVAFKMFVIAILGSASGATFSYIAVYAASYIIGFLALFAPGGVVVRESALVAGMVRLGLANQPDAFAVAVASRLWLTVVELVPGFIALGFARRSSNTQLTQ
ncbi:MAG TPA: lysylphosphatidylglycerol synthase domain-containing protein [Gemmatimonadaceae bacterium]|nr:lysylphosphatidylglycerol synthase domain-containing protein [Gemmatimonadaceae bacterium]